MNDSPNSVAPAPRAPIMNHREVREIYVQLATISTKLDAMAALHLEIDKTDGTVSDHETRIVKLEGFQGLILWIVNGGWGVLAIAAYLLAKFGVL